MNNKPHIRGCRSGLAVHLDRTKSCGVGMALAGRSVTCSSTILIAGGDSIERVFDLDSMFDHTSLPLAVQRCWKGEQSKYLGN